MLNKASKAYSEMMKKIESMENDSNWDIAGIAVTGIHHRYPPCCIEAFCLDLTKGVTPASRALNEEGFIPCMKHYGQYRSKPKELHKLRVNGNINLKIIRHINLPSIEK